MGSGTTGYFNVNSLEGYKNVLIIGTHGRQLIESQLYPIAPIKNHSINGSGIFMSTYNGSTLFGASIKYVSDTQFYIFTNTYDRVFIFASK